MKERRDSGLSGDGYRELGVKGGAKRRKEIGQDFLEKMRKAKDKEVMQHREEERRLKGRG